MRVLRGRATTPEADQAATQQLIDDTAVSEQSGVRVWTPHRQVAFGRRDTTREGYNRAREVVSDCGFSCMERSVGGHAVVFTGNTVAFVRTEPVEDIRTDIDARYERTTETIRSALSALDVDTEEDEPDGAFCPGTYSLSATGKIVGLAQRVRKDVAVVAGVVVVCDHEEIAGILEPVYDALDIPFDPNTTGSLARAGGETDRETVLRVIEKALATANPTVEQVRET